MTADSDPAPQQNPLIIGQDLGRYRVRRKLGAGGMAIVYEAEHVDLGKRCAIKILNPEHAKSPEIRARFLREGQAASRIGHRNVVDVYDVVSSGDITYLVMEFLEGEDMGSFLDREGAISETKTADILVPVASALCRAHELGIVHRDIKPDNIFLVGGQAQTGGKRSELHPKVVDFGISKLMEAQAHELTQTSAMLGTPMYMSPEQARASKNVTAATDQYSLGVIAYQAVTGVRPFDGDTLYTLLHAIVCGDFAPPSSQVNIHARFESLILRAMQNAPENRFPSMDALGRALLPFASERIRLLYEGDFAQGSFAGHTLHLPGSPGSDARELARAETHRAEASGNTAPQRAAPRADSPKEASTSQASLSQSAATVSAVSGNVRQSSPVGVPPSSPKVAHQKWILSAAGLVGATAIVTYVATSHKLAPEPPAEHPTEQPPTLPTVSEPEADSAPRTSMASAAARPEGADTPAAASQPRTVSLSTSAAGARAYVNGEDRGPLPVRLEVPAKLQELELEVRAPGYQPAHRTWTDADGENIAFTLQPVPRPSRGEPPSGAPKVEPTRSAARPIASPAPAAENRQSAPLLAPR